MQTKGTCAKSFHVRHFQVCFGAPKHICVAQAEAVHALFFVMTPLCIPRSPWLGASGDSVITLSGQQLCSGHADAESI